MGAKKGISGQEVQYNAEISKRIEVLRKERRMQHSDLAVAAGVTRSMLTAYEAGNTRWPAFRLRLIADYFRVPVDHLLPKSSHNVNSPAIQENLL